MVLELQPVMQKIKIPSKSENIHLVEKLVDDVCAEVGVHEEKYGNILIALTEAVNNAIHHGNDLDPNKDTVIQCNQDEEKLTFVIKDEGPGFDFNNLPEGFLRRTNFLLFPLIINVGFDCPNFVLVAIQGPFSSGSRRSKAFDTLAKSRCIEPFLFIY